MRGHHPDTHPLLGLGVGTKQKVQEEKGSWTNIPAFSSYLEVKPALPDTFPWL